MFFFNNYFVKTCGLLRYNNAISNCYTACEFMCADNNYSNDYTFGYSGNSLASNTTITNCYYKTAPKLSDGIPSGNGVVGKSETDLKAAGMVTNTNTPDVSLNYNGNTAWKQDLTPPINKGYPILGWMRLFSYISTYPVENLAKETATLHGFTFTNGETITERGFDWREKGVTTWTNVPVSDTTANIFYPLAGLTKNTTYEYRAYMKILGEAAYRYGDTVEFTTLSNASTVITLAATNITETTATINGSVSEEIEDLVTERGFEWRKSGITSWTSASATGTSNISASLIGLTKGTTYEFRAYIRAAALRYGEILQFTTVGVGVLQWKIENGELRIYPNPTKGQLSIESTELKIERVEILDILGQCIFTTPAPPKEGNLQHRHSSPPSEGQGWS